MEAISEEIPAAEDALTFAELKKSIWRKTLMNSKTASNLLPYPVIVLAASGDVDAIFYSVCHP